MACLFRTPVARLPWEKNKTKGERTPAARSRGDHRKKKALLKPRAKGDFPRDSGKGKKIKAGPKHRAQKLLDILSREGSRRTLLKNSQVKRAARGREKKGGQKK